MQIDSIETAEINQKVTEGLKRGNDALKALHEGLSVEYIEDLLLDIEENIEKQNEIDQLLQGADFTNEDEDNLIKELETIIKQHNPESIEEEPIEEKPIEELSNEKSVDNLVESDDQIEEDQVLDA